MERPPLLQPSGRYPHIAAWQLRISCSSIQRTTAKPQTKRGRSVAISNHGVSQMNSDEVNWLLQTIKDPENARRFVQAQYQRGRIPYHVMASLARDRNWRDWPAIEKPAALISMECITTQQKILAATMLTGTDVTEVLATSPQMRRKDASSQRRQNMEIRSPLEFFVRSPRTGSSTYPPNDE
jgi:hypothetical protein